MTVASGRFFVPLPAQVNYVARSLRLSVPFTSPDYAHLKVLATFVFIHTYC